MNPVLFGVVFGSIIIFLIVDILTSKALAIPVPVVKAGKVSDFYNNIEILNRNLPQFINVNGKKVNVSGHTVLYVHGESMWKYKIHDKQLVFIKPTGCLDVITQHPVLVFWIVNPKPDDAEYKLRKFICQIDSLEGVNWSDIYEQNKGRISITKEEFIKQCEGKAQKDKKFLVGKIVLSETFDVAQQKDTYSLHPLSTVFGTVEYAV